MVSGVQHAGEILDLFTACAPEWGCAAAARELGISKSHAHRLLGSLADLGLLEHQPSSRRYRLGVRSLALASVLLQTNPLIANALPVMRLLKERLGVEAALAVWDRGGLLWLQPSADRLLTRRELVDCVAAGTVVLAGRPETDIQAALHIADEPVVACGASSAGELRGRLQHVSAGGMIGDFRAGNGGACFLAAPIVDSAGGVVAALSMQAPRARWQVHRHEFTCALRSAVLRLDSTVSTS